MRGTYPQGVLSLLLLVADARSQSVSLLPDQCGTWEGLGTSVAISGRWAFIGAPYSDRHVGESPIGAAFVFEFDGTAWQQRQRLQPSDPSLVGEFGVGMAAFGDRVVVAVAHQELTPLGSALAYVFRYDGAEWVEEQLLTRMVSGADCNLYIRVAMDRNTIMIATPLDQFENSATGAIHVFQFDGDRWEYAQRLPEPLEAVSPRQFGRTIALSGDFAVVGTYESRAMNPFWQTAYYVFRHDDQSGRWALEQELLLPNNDSWVSGEAAAVHGNKIVIAGSIRSSAANQVRSNAVYVYRFDGSLWRASQKLKPPNEIDKRFGSAVGVTEDAIVVGSSESILGFSQAGSVYSFHRCPAGFFFAQKHTQAVPSDYAAFGSAIAMSGNTVNVGAPGTILDCGEDGFPGEGTAHVLTLHSAVCAANGFPVACTSGSQGVGDCNGNRILDACDVVADIDFDCDSNGVPDECELSPQCTECAADCNGNGAIDACDVARSVSLDCNENRVPDECEMPPLCATCPDCNANSVPDDCDVTTQTSLDCNVNGIPDECEPDCDHDGVADGCDRWGRLQTADRKAAPYFGWSTSVSGNFAIVGAPYDSRVERQPWTGSAYTFRRVGAAWYQEQKLEPSGDVTGDYFGVSVAISSEWAAVGAFTDDLGFGAVYLFRFNGAAWEEHSTIRAPQPRRGDRVGLGIALSGNHLLVGGTGHVYAFEFDGMSWAYQSELLPWHPETTIEFGPAVAIDGELALVGAPETWDGTRIDGAAFAYRFDGSAWVPLQVISPTKQTAEYGRFGGSVAISGRRALVGMHYPYSGCFYSYDGREWGDPQCIPALPGAARFSSISESLTPEVALRGNLAVVGAPSFMSQGLSSVGAVYLFGHDGEEWREQRKLVPGGGRERQHFGYSVALSADSLIVGAPASDYHQGPPGTTLGAVYSLDVSFRFGDVDLDGIVTSFDHSAALPCQTGPSTGPDADVPFGCLATFDFDGDEHVDLADWAAIQRSFGCPN